MKPPPITLQEAQEAYLISTNADEVVSGDKYRIEYSIIWRSGRYTKSHDDLRFVTFSERIPRKQRKRLGRELLTSLFLSGPGKDTFLGVEVYHVYHDPEEDTQESFVLRELLEDAASRMGWDNETQLRVVFNFVEYGLNPECFGPYLARCCREEEEMTKG